MNTEHTQLDIEDIIAAVPSKNDRILRLNEVKTLTGLSRSSIYAYMKAGEFPQHIQLGRRSVGWYESEVRAWIASRVRMVRE